ncbi:MAG: hypothetical protein EOO09_22465 [Chitinophagaceae bacterium]|nr:MAG: hypothetical protein EOO09_22465 [Chitinophagaceae bacterium]
MGRSTPKFFKLIIAGILFSLMFKPAFGQKKILFITSNAEFYGNSKIPAANHFEEIVIPYHLFAKSGITVDFISPEGGAIPLGYINSSDSVQKKYLYDAVFMNKLKHTLNPKEVKAEEYSAVFYAGGGAAMFGVAQNETIQNITKKIYGANGVVAAICHGTAGLAYLKDDAGESLYKAKKITGFPNKFESSCFLGLCDGCPYPTFMKSVSNSTKNRPRRHAGRAGDPGMTLLEMTVVIMVMLTLITVLFFGVQAWKRGSDRAICIVHIQNVQKGVRSFSNLYGYVEGSNVSNLQNHVIGLGKFVDVAPVCPGQGTYSYGANFGTDTIPPTGELYAECSLKTSGEHEPPEHSDW